MAKEQIKGNIGILFLITLVMNLVYMGLGMIPWVGFVASILVMPAIYLAMYGIYINLTNGIKPQVSDLFSQLRNFWPAFKTQFLMIIYIMLWSLLLYIPGIIKGIAYSQTMFILEEDPNLGANEAITRSREMMNGHKMEYFLLLLSFLGWVILSPLTLGLLNIWLIPYMQTTLANYYKYLKGEIDA
jgi:uncharacterized membrane protein